MEAPSDHDKCIVEFRVRYAECDAQGFLHHARYWEYFEHARTELLRRSGIRYRDMEHAGTFFVVYKASCKYLQPIRYDDLVTVEVSVRRVTRTRVEHDYVIRLDGTTMTEATSTLACVGRDGRPTIMPDALWEKTSGSTSD